MLRAKKRAKIARRLARRPHVARQRRRYVIRDCAKASCSPDLNNHANPRLRSKVLRAPGEAQQQLRRRAHGKLVARARRGSNCAGCVRWSLQTNIKMPGGTPAHNLHRLCVHRPCARLRWNLSDQRYIAGQFRGTRGYKAWAAAMARALHALQARSAAEARTASESVARMRPF